MFIAVAKPLAIRLRVAQTLGPSEKDGGFLGEGICMGDSFSPLTQSVGKGAGDGVEKTEGRANYVLSKKTSTQSKNRF